MKSNTLVHSVMTDVEWIFALGSVSRLNQQKMATTFSFRFFWVLAALLILSSSLIADILLCFGVTKKNKCLCLAWLIAKPALTVLAILALALGVLITLPYAMKKSWRRPTEEQFAFGTLLSLTLISLLHPIINIRCGFQTVFEFSQNGKIHCKIGDLFNVFKVQFFAKEVLD